MIFTFGSLAASTPYLGAVLLFIVVMWLNAAASLNKQFVAISEKAPSIDEGDKQSEMKVASK